MGNNENGSILFKNYKIKKKFINGGSPVKKYLLSKGTDLYLLRLFDPRFISSRKKAFDYIKLLYDYGISVQEPIEFGVCNDEQNAYMIVEWIEGKSIDDLFKNCSSNERFELGVRSGQETQKFHSVNLQKSVNLIEQYREKILKKKRKFQSLGIINTDIIKIFEYLENNLNLLQNVTTSIVHGDIHAGNIMIDHFDNLVFIDLDVCDYGPSWYDLASNSCLLNNNEYYAGLIDGYFESSIPENFWQTYIFYGCLYCLDYILYSIRTENLGLLHGLSAVNNFMCTTNQLNKDVPNWYKKIETKELRKK